jgi:outer membrane protein assembly factor BamB
MYHDKILVATPRASVFALDARTGKLVWETQKADPSAGYSQSAGPIIAGGVIVTGIGGCGRARKEGCFITGHDPESGQRPAELCGTFSTFPANRSISTPSSSVC